MKNIVQLINEAGIDVATTLDNKVVDRYFQETVLLYSLTENLLKFLIATKELWDENCRNVDAAIEKEKETGKPVPEEELEQDFDKVRKKAKRLTFNDAINKAFDLGLINEATKDKLHDMRAERNTLVHLLYSYKDKNNQVIMRTKLEEAERIVMQLLPVFTSLLYDEIGFTEDELPEIFIPLDE
ncbi:hypothetical protein [uncultured Bacteroides sp.]|jgi:hypothetical protein|uniref:hypothetical protein n=1 Tax=uncultured Bacteroides sp. TaxID=162156 RepID=UPI0020623CAD|nr:hypothetical protein [uncultured Bacteroides sp.]DAS84559.1 MAG TPA: Toxin-antitoxin system antidote Mnt family-antitoxin, HEPN-MNT, ANTITOXIN-TOXIN complex [Caudoviricetes sp.]